MQQQERQCGCRGCRCQPPSLLALPLFSHYPQYDIVDVNFKLLTLYGMCYNTLTLYGICCKTTRALKVDEMRKSTHEMRDICCK